MALVLMDHYLRIPRAMRGRRESRTPDHHAEPANERRRGASCAVAVVGASSLIGEAVIAGAPARKSFRWPSCTRSRTSAMSAGSIADEDGADGTELKTSDVAAFDFSRVDLVFFCGRAALSERYAEAAAAHAWVIDNSPAFRSARRMCRWSRPT